MDMDTQELVQQVLLLATLDSVNPDPVAAKAVVLTEKPLIAEETDLLEATLLDELICHIASLACVYHKPPTAFVEGKVGPKRMLPVRASGVTDSDQEVAGATIIPEPDSLIGAAVVPRGQGDAPAPDLLGGGLDQHLAGGTPEPTAG